MGSGYTVVNQVAPIPAFLELMVWCGRKRFHG